MTRDIVSEAANWRARAERAEAEIRRMHNDAARSSIEQREQAQREEDQRRAAERKAANETALESERVNSWFNYRMEQAIAGGDAAFTSFLYGDLERHRKNIPVGWPDGVSPSTPAVDVLLDDAEPKDGEKHVSQTALWKAVRKHGCTPPGYKPNGYRKQSPAV